MKSSRVWLWAIATGTLMNFSLFLVLPALAEKEEAVPPPVITVELGEWQPVQKVEQVKKAPRKARPQAKKKPEPAPPKPVPPRVEEKKVEPPPAKPMIPEEPVLTDQPAPVEKSAPPQPVQTSEPEEFALPAAVPRFQLSKIARYIHKETPEYPPEMRALGREAIFKIKVLIDNQGRVRKIYPADNIDSAFNQAAMKAIYNSSFEPAEKNGKRVAAILIIPVRFTLR